MDTTLFAGIVLLGLVWGYSKGALPVAFKLICFFSGYVIAWQFTPALAQWLTTHHKLEGIIVYPAAGTALFFTTGILLNIISSLILRFLSAETKAKGKPIGALLGAGFALIFAVVTVWSLGMLKTAQAQRQNTVPAAPSVMQQFSGNIIGKVTEAIIPNKQFSKAAAQIIRDPVSVTQGVQHIANQPAFRELFSNPSNFAILTQGSADDIMRQPSFQQLAQDSQSMQFFEQTGLTGNTDQEKQRNLATQLSTYAKSSQQLKNTPEYNDIIHDAEIMAQIKQGNYFSLLSNDKVKRLAQKLNVSTPEKITAGEQGNVGDGIGGINITSQKIYKWKDKKGHTNYSSEKPPVSDVDGEAVLVSQ